MKPCGPARASLDRRPQESGHSGLWVRCLIWLSLMGAMVAGGAQSLLVPPTRGQPVAALTARAKVGGYLTNQYLFEQIQAALQQPRFSDTQRGLDSVNPAHLRDAELVEFARLTEAMVTLCFELDAPHPSGQTLAEVVFNLDYATVHRLVEQVGRSAAQDDEPLARTRIRRLAVRGNLAKEADRWVETALGWQKQLPRYRELAHRLALRYARD